MSPNTPRSNTEPKEPEQPAQNPVPTEGIESLSLGSANRGAPTQPMELDDTGKGNDCTPPEKSPLLVGSIHSMHADPVRVALEACKELEESRIKAGNAFTLATAKTSNATASEKNELKKEFNDITLELKQAKAIWHSMYPTRLEFFSQEDMERVRQEEAAKKTRAPIIVPKDLPALQLPGMKQWEPSKVVHDTAAAFIRAFKKEVKAYHLVPEEEWERLCGIQVGIARQYRVN